MREQDLRDGYEEIRCWAAARATLIAIAAIYPRLRYHLQTIIHQIVRKGGTYQWWERRLECDKGVWRDLVGLHPELREPLRGVINTILWMVGDAPADFLPIENWLFGEDQLSAPIERSLYLSIRTFGVLQRMGCQTLGDVVALTMEQLLAQRNGSPKVVEEVQDFLASYGLRLTGDTGD